jgi:isopentenyl diphosphate isomerase/L-lactate dehydrogenase-like FMN-dependent dehydrogenase
VNVPLIVAPTALHYLADPEGEVATARGAGQAGVVYCYNYFLASKPIDQIAQQPGEKWLHLYLFEERHLVEFAIEEALEKYKGIFSAVIVTLE